MLQRSHHFLVLSTLATSLMASPTLAQTRPVQKAAATAAKPAKVEQVLVPASVVAEAERYETQLKAAFKPGKVAARELVANGQKAMGAVPTNPRAAAKMGGIFRAFPSRRGREALDFHQVFQPADCRQGSTNH